MIVAITGRSGSGKSTVAEILRQIGCIVLDADVVAHDILGYKECKNSLIDAFGTQILNDNAEINRKELGKIAFSTQENTDLLTKITHTYIVEILLNQIEKAKQSGAKTIYVDGAVILDSLFEKHCDKIISVITKDEICIQRIMARDNISKEQAELRLSRQMSPVEFFKRSTYVVMNDKHDVADIKEQVLNILKQI